MLKFDENGKKIPQVSKEEAHYKIQQNLAEYNDDVRANNLLVRIVEALAAVKVILPNTEAKEKVMKKIEALLSPELSARVEHQMLIIDAYRRAGVKYDKTKIAKNVQVILRALQDGAGKY